MKCVETLAAQERCDSWNVPDRNRDSPIMMALRRNRIDIVKVLTNCPHVDLNVVNRDSKHLEDIAW